MPLELDERDAPGLEVDQVHVLAGLRGLGVWPHRLQGCRIPAANPVGE